MRNKYCVIVKKSKSLQIGLNVPPKDLPQNVYSRMMAWCSDREMGRVELPPSVKTRSLRFELKMKKIFWIAIFFLLVRNWKCTFTKHKLARIWIEFLSYISYLSLYDMLLNSKVYCAERYSTYFPGWKSSRPGLSRNICWVTPKSPCILIDTFAPIPAREKEEVDTLTWYSVRKKT